MRSPESWAGEQAAEIIPAVPTDEVPATVIHETYLPFSAAEFGRHVADVTGGGRPDRHTRYYRDSAEAAGRLAERASATDGESSS